MAGLKSMRLIALTGYGQAEDFERARMAGFDNHLVKPVDLVRLERTLAGLPEKDTPKHAEPGPSRG